MAVSAYREIPQPADRLKTGRLAGGLLDRPWSARPRTTPTSTTTTKITALPAPGSQAIDQALFDGLGRLTLSPSPLSRPDRRRQRPVKLPIRDETAFA